MSGPVENKIYLAIVGICEGKEAAGQYRGNGHHLAQALTVKVSEALLPKQQRKIYDVLTGTPMSCGEISTLCGLDSRTVSAQLKQIDDKTLLIGYKRSGRLRLWSKRNTD